MLTARADRFGGKFLVPSQTEFHGGLGKLGPVEQQFGGISFGVGGLGIPIFGSTGGASIPGGFSGAPGVGGGGIGPVLTLEGEFGVGFTAQDIADQIRVAEQEGELSGGQVIEIATGPSLRLVLNLAVGLFELFNASGQKVGGGVTPQAAIEAANAGAAPAGGGGAQPQTFPETLTAVTTPPFVAPQQVPIPIDDPAFLRNLAAILRGVFLRRTGRDPPPLPIGFPGSGRPGLPPPFPEIFTIPPIPNEGIRFPAPGAGDVLPGGTVNVPVVLGSTGDPTGVRRPTFPNQEQLSRAQQIGQIIRDLLALRKARQNADKQRRAFEQFLAARLAILGGQQMPFGQAGFVGGSVLGGALGAAAESGLEALIRGLSGGGGDRLPMAPGGLPPLQGPGTFPMLPGSGGGGVCPPLFRTGAPAGFSMRPVPWFPVQAPNGKWFFFGHLGTPTFSRLKARRRHHHHSRKR